MASPLPDRFTTTPSSPFAAGTVVHVCFDNSALLSSTVSITVDSGTGTVQALAIALDAEGHGCVDWTAPNWDGAFFQHSTSADHAVVIT